MKLVYTTISATAVRMRYADNPDAAKATTWIDFQMPLAELAHPKSRTGNDPLGETEMQFLAEVHLAALRRARDIIGDETQRLVNLGAHMR